MQCHHGCIVRRDFSEEPGRIQGVGKHMTVVYSSLKKKFQWNPHVVFLNSRISSFSVTFLRSEVNNLSDKLALFTGLLSTMFKSPVPKGYLEYFHLCLSFSAVVKTVL